MTLDNILDKLSDVRTSGDGFIASCPAHEDSNPSLSVHQADDGRILLNCFAGCDFTSICDSLGITPADLRPSGRGHVDAPRQPAPAPTRGPGFTSVESALSACRIPTGCKQVALYRYDRDGQAFGAVARYESATGKTFRQVHFDGRWHPGGPSEQWPSFRPNPSDEGPVFIVEGEKCCLAGAELGLDFATSAGGSNAPQKTDWTPLAGRTVCILPDNDSPGKQYAEKVRDILISLSPPATVAIIELEGIPLGGDLVEWLSARESSSTSGDLAAELLELAAQPAAPEFFYDRDRRDWMLLNGRGIWLRLSDANFKKELGHRGFPTLVPKGKSCSIADEKMILVRDQFDVGYAGPLAGWRSGFYETPADRILITQSPNIIMPVQGEWPTLQALLTGLLGHTDHQLDHLFGWLKVATESLRSGDLRPGQALILCGERASGKSLFQKILTILFGGRVAKPYQYLIGQTSFNGDLFEAEHLEIADEPSASIDIRSRRTFGSMIKQITANESQRCHAKYRNALTLNPFWRLTISVNDEPENLLILPLLDPSIEDKLLFFHCASRLMPMPTASTAQRKLFFKTLVDELPAFLHFLDQYEIPAALSSERFGVAHYLNPDLVHALSTLTPEFHVLQLLDRCLFSTESARKQHPTWEGTAADVEAILQNDPSASFDARRLLSWPLACATYLGRLANQIPERVKRHRTSASRRWIITAPPADPETG